MPELLKSHPRDRKNSRHHQRDRPQAAEKVEVEQVKYTSAIAATGSGSIGGATASRNKGGQYFRRRAIPTNPATEQQQAVRNGLASLTNAWSNTLTDAQRAAWDVYAFNVAWIDSLGQSIKLSGQQMYIRSNVPRLQAGLARVQAGPTTYSLGTLTTPVVTSINDDGSSAINFTNTDEWATQAGGALLVYFSRPVSPAINFFKGPYQYAGRVNGATTPPTSPSMGITAPFEMAGQAGNRVFVQFRGTSADGRLSSVQRGSIIVTEV